MTEAIELTVPAGMDNWIILVRTPPTEVKKYGTILIQAVYVLLTSLKFYDEFQMTITFDGIQMVSLVWQILRINEGFYKFALYNLPLKKKEGGNP